MRSAEVRFAVGTEWFECRMTSDPAESSRGFDSRGRGARWEPLCRVVDTGWAYPPADFLGAVVERHGYGWEGDVAFSFEEAGVELFFFELELVVTEQFFLAYVAAYGRACLAAHDELGLRVKERRQVEELLGTVEARAAVPR